jgi:hypothetical protein
MDGGADDHYRGRVYFAQLGSDAARWLKPSTTVLINPTYHPAVSSFFKFSTKAFDFDAASARSTTIVKFYVPMSSSIPPSSTIATSSS